jgi:hypothetical protein
MYAKHATEWLTLREGSTRRGTSLSPLYVNERRPCAPSDRIASAFYVYANADQSGKTTRDIHRVYDQICIRRDSRGLTIAGIPISDDRDVTRTD